MEIIKADLDEIVFEGRNKLYGAYVLRKMYSRNTVIAFFLAVLFLLVALATPYAAQFIAGLGPEEEVKLETIAELTEPPALNEEEQPEEIKVEPPPPPQRAEVKFVEPEVVEHEEADPEQTIKEVEELKVEADIGGADVEGDPDAAPDIGYIEEKGSGKGPAELAPVAKEPDPNEFIQAEKLPVAVNMDAIKAKLKFPDVLQQSGIQGKVMTRILVNENGDPVKFIVLRSPHELFTKEVEKHYKELKFTPAIQAGRPIKIWVTIPFEFTLN